ncbi:cyclin-A1 isoform X1 [Solea solea]|uniref:cyclin-A1 isoform X1 n=2 Tax=Solea solea TaxID=90069 RepID=UPI00272BD5D5|nr:cyclin-A1 isoform X1 [Solea solea]
MMNASNSSPRSKENILPVIKVHAARERTVLGVLSENQQGGQFSRHSSVSGSSHHANVVYTSSSTLDIYADESREVVLTASGQEVVSDGYDPVLQREALSLIWESISSPYQESSQQSDIDDSISVEVLGVCEYAEDVHKHLRESEVKFRPMSGYLEKHPEITSGMRVVLVDWMAEVAHEYHLSSETLHLAVSALDRFLSCTSHVKRSKLQLVGTAALLIASKYEEICPPDVNEFIYTTDSTYTKKQLLQMEHILLRILAFRVAAPTTRQFLRLYTSIQSVCAATESLALYVADLSLLEIEPFLHYTPSIVAAGVYCLASYTVHRSLWPDSLSAFTGYTLAEIEPCLSDLHKLYISAESFPHQAIREKYMSSRYCCASKIAPPAVLPQLHPSSDTSATAEFR